MYKSGVTKIFVEFAISSSAESAQEILSNLFIENQLYADNALPVTHRNASHSILRPVSTSWAARSKDAVNRPAISSTDDGRHAYASRGISSSKVFKLR